jgi:hypothetical protein
VALYGSLCESLGKKQELLAKQQQVGETQKLKNTLSICDAQLVDSHFAGARQTRL